MPFGAFRWVLVGDTKNGNKNNVKRFCCRLCRQHVDYQQNYQPQIPPIVPRVRIPLCPPPQRHIPPRKPAARRHARATCLVKALRPTGSSLDKVENRDYLHALCSGSSGLSHSPCFSSRPHRSRRRNGLSTSCGSRRRLAASISAFTPGRMLWRRSMAGRRQLFSRPKPAGIITRFHRTASATTSLPIKA